MKPPFFRSSVLMVCLAVMAFCLPALAQAATLTVPAQYPTIQAAINASANGDTVLIADGTYTGDGNRDIDFGGKNITATSQNGSAKTIIDCGGSSSANHRGFYLHGGETQAVISGLTIENGFTSSVSGVADSGFGGGICLDGSAATIRNCVVTKNVAQLSSGGIHNENNSYNFSNGTTNIIGCLVMDNSAQEGSSGGIGNSSNNYSGKGAVTTITNCTVAGNTAFYNGGGITSSDTNAGTITLTDCLITGNTSQNGSGGGVYNMNANSGGTITLVKCTVTNNVSSNGTNLSDGGGVYNLNSNANQNAIYSGSVSTSKISLIECIISGNNARNGSGGGVDNYNYYGGTIALTRCKIVGNFTDTNGGGVLSENGGSGGLTILTNCIVTGNNAGNGQGGASATLPITTSTATA